MTAITIDSKYSRRVDFLNSATVCPCRAPGGPADLFGFGSHLEHRQERFLRDLDLPHPLHALLAFFLLLEELALARNVAAVALGEHVLAHRLDRFAGDDPPADGGLNRHF